MNLIHTGLLGATYYEKVEYQSLKRSIRRWTVFFIAALIISGITAFPVQSELHFLLGFQYSLPEYMRWWLMSISAAVDQMANETPQLLYGYDWLAYAHIVIALFFYGVYKNPVQNRWVVRIGMLACAGVFLLAFICGSIRQIPFFWTLIDCAFGFFGLLPLWVIDKRIGRLMQLESENTNS
jgi:hypothetical protein